MMERHFDENLQALKYQLMKMSALAEVMISDAIKAVVDRNEEVIPAVYEREELVNQMQVEIDETCLTQIALHQPAAGDLRFIMGAAKANADLERLADEAINIVKRAKTLLTEPPLKPFIIIPEMAMIARGMVRDSLHAFVNRNANLAREVMFRDDRLDALKTAIAAELTDCMTMESSAVSRALNLLLVSRYLERIGDHATNIAEISIFVVEGRDVRHHADRKP
ncbi:MAG TPA: phosphate transport system regulatory protein PhoU [Verrucomicrobia bacterium]|nr:phosphate transport system regulatory protein PhoU [Verrucomicrobiota bacterium]